MAAAPGTHPKLIRRPRTIGCRIAHLHLRAASHAPDVEVDVAHGRDFITWASSVRSTSVLIPAVVLAAGRSSRMGRAKAALPIGRETFLTRILRTFHEAGVNDIVVVLGHDADAIAPLVNTSPYGARVVVNPGYDRGQLSSLQAGLALVDRPGLDGILMTLVDLPLVSSDTVRAVLDRFRTSRAPIVRPVSGARHGHPILIARTLFGALRLATDAEGAKPVVRAHVSAAGDVVVNDEGAFQDIDTMEEYARLIGDESDDGLAGGPSRVR